MFLPPADRRRIGSKVFCVRRAWFISCAWPRNLLTTIMTRRFPRFWTPCGSQDNQQQGVIELRVFRLRPFLHGADDKLPPRVATLRRCCRKYFPHRRGVRTLPASSVARVARARRREATSAPRHAQYPRDRERRPGRWHRLRSCCADEG